MNHVGGQIKLAPLLGKLRAEQLSERTGISRRTIYYVENKN